MHYFQMLLHVINLLIYLPDAHKCLYEAQAFMYNLDRSLTKCAKCVGAGQR